ncbi:MAG: hypothetical protein ACO1OB_18400 [Archangium sp.]
MNTSCAAENCEASELKRAQPFAVIQLTTSTPNVANARVISENLNSWSSCARSSETGLGNLRAARRRASSFQTINQIAPTMPKYATACPRNAGITARSALGSPFIATS